MSKFRNKQFIANIKNQLTSELRLTRNIMELAVLGSVVYITAAAVFYIYRLCLGLGI